MTKKPETCHKCGRPAKVDLPGGRSVVIKRMLKGRLVAVCKTCNAPRPARERPFSCR